MDQQEQLMEAMIKNKARIDNRELALATGMAAKNKLTQELSVATEEMKLVKSASLVDTSEVRRLTSDIAKLTRDLRSEELFCNEKLEEIRILKMKHYDLQQQFAQLQTKSNVFKFPPGAV